MKKIRIVILLFASIMIVSGCGKKDTPKYSGYDYNQEPISTEENVWTPKGLYILEYNILNYISPKGKSTILCSKAECKHNDPSCEAYLDSDNIFYYNDRLCYAKIDVYHHKTTIYTMNWKGKERTKYFTIEFPDDFKEERQRGNSNYSFNTIICGSSYILDSRVTTDTKEKRKCYYTNLDDPSKQVEINLNVCGDGTIFRAGKDWLVFVTEDRRTGESYLSAYNIHSKEMKKVVNRSNLSTGNLGWLTDVKIKGDDLYWYELGVGFCKKNMKKESDPDKKTLLFPLKKNEGLGAGQIGKDYLILCNMKFPGNINPIPEEMEGISFYSYHGDLIQFVPTPNKNYQYFMESKDKLFFIDILSEGSSPDVYIEKAKIKDGTAKIVQIEKIRQKIKDEK